MFHPILHSAFLLLCCGIFQHCDGWCQPFTYDDWHSWGSCSVSCGGGTRQRYKESCVQRNKKYDTGTCNEICYNGGTYSGSSCHCKPWRNGSCCQYCSSTYNIPHCLSNQCGGNPDNIRCSNCKNPYFSGGFGKGCLECNTIQYCKNRHCSSANNTICDECFDDNIFFKRSHSNTKCESLCAWDKHECWPGSCIDGLTRQCNCTSGFTKFSSPTETSCQLDDNNTPTIVSCFTAVAKAGPNERQANKSTCERHIFYGNFIPNTLHFDVTASFRINISSITQPAFIAESKFGVTDMTLYLLRKEVSGRMHEEARLVLLEDYSNGLNATETYLNKDSIPLHVFHLILNNGESLCMKFKVLGGGYLKAKDLRNNHELQPVPYKKSKVTEMICYTFDNARPQHCLQTNSCLFTTNEPLFVNTRVSRSPIIRLQFDGWFDPIPPGGNKEQASGIKSYEINVHAVNNGRIEEKSMANFKLNTTDTSLTLHLTPDEPGLYCIVLKVKDFADNVQQARRFLIYDNTSHISVRADKSFIVSSASNETKFMWQTHGERICLDWKGYFYNKFYIDNNILGPIKSDPSGLIAGIYDQQFGLLPVTGTTSVNGITEFRFSWRQTNHSSSNEISIPNTEHQTYCKQFNLSDGESYTLSIRAVDIVNNSLAENRTVHIDRSKPVLKIKGLLMINNESLLVHNDTDLSKLNIEIETMDQHSGIKHIAWRFGFSETGMEIINDDLPVNRNVKKNCHDDSDCYCPNFGDCEALHYTIALSKLGWYIGQNYKKYWLTVNVTNNAMLFTTEQVEILIDLCASTTEIQDCAKRGCSKEHIPVCEFCSQGFSAIKGNTSCFDVTAHHDSFCHPDIQDHCFIIFKESHTWSDEEAICKTRNGNLFVPGDMEEELLLEKYLVTVKELLHFSKKHLWIGGRIQDSNEHWVTHKDNMLNRWATVQEMNRNGTSCIAMDALNSFKWVQLGCDQYAFFICKETAPYHPPVQPQLIG